MDNDVSTLPCANCGFSEHLQYSDYCQNCGIDLCNYCTNQQCESSNCEKEYSLPHDAKYCPYCGNKTTYFDFLSSDKSTPQNAQ